MLTIGTLPHAAHVRIGAVVVALAALAAGCGGGIAASRSTSDPSTSTSRRTASSTSGPTSTVPPATLPTLAPALQGLPQRVYVPNGQDNTVSVIDPATRQVIGRFKTGRQPQHIVPSYDLRTLWVLDNKGDDLIPIDPSTGTPGAHVHVTDPYNLYFTPDGSDAIVVAEALERLDFRDPHTLALRRSVPLHGCGGANHLDYPADYSYLVITCEFAGRLAKVDYRSGQVVGMLDLPPDPSDGTTSMPQDIRVGPDGHTFYVADMTRGGVYLVDGSTFSITGFIPTGVGTHGLTPSRDGKLLYVANRGSRSMTGAPHGPGSLSVLDLATNQVTATWPVPGGGSPDMGNLSTDGTQLWLSGRFDSEVYVFDLAHGGLAARIPVGRGPHGMTYWPQPGRFSLGHTGNMR